MFENCVCVCADGFRYLWLAFALVYWPINLAIAIKLHDNVKRKAGFCVPDIVKQTSLREK